MHEMADDDMTDDDADRPNDLSARPRDHEASRIDPPQWDGISNADDLHANHSHQARRRELELQLQKLRSEASAARLDAKAAEIELMIRRLSAEFPTSGLASPASAPTLPSSESFSPPDAIPSDSGGPAAGSLQTDNSLTDAPIVFQNWNAVRTRDGSADRSSTRSWRSRSRHRAESAPMIRSRFDAAHPVPKHHFDSTPELESDTQPPSDGSPSDRHGPPLSHDAMTDAAEMTTGVIGDVDSPGWLPHAREAASVTFDSVMPGDVQINAELEVDNEESRKRSRPAAWLVSALTHVAILVLLAAIGLTQHRPKDQVALTATAPSTEQVSMETFEIESSEPETDPQPNEPNPSEVQYDLSPVGSISASELITEAPPAPPSSSLSAMLSRSTSASSSILMKTSTDATTEFCGVKGGGNHFVYLVDSSGSMGDAFDSARAELLHSIDLLKPEQRFYVIFFDAEPDYMRLTDAHVDEPRSVKATRVNRDALKRWAMRINKDRGSAPTRR